MEDAAGMVVIILATAAVLFALLRRAQRTSRTIKVSSVIDGDTIYTSGRSYRIHGIDAPEMTQPGGEAAKAHLSRLIQGRHVSVEFTDTDKYGRPVVRLFSKDGDIGRCMVEDGYARAYFHEDYRRHELQAIRHKRGLWAAKGGMVNPAKYRREKRGSRR